MATTILLSVTPYAQDFINNLIYVCQYIISFIYFLCYFFNFLNKDDFSNRMDFIPLGEVTFRFLSCNVCSPAILKLGAHTLSLTHTYTYNHALTHTHTFFCYQVLIWFICQFQYISSSLSIDIRTPLQSAKAMSTKKLKVLHHHINMNSTRKKSHVLYQEACLSA